MRKLFLSLLCIVSFLSSNAQQATSSGSGSGTAGNITLDWSIGELTLVSTVRNEGFVLTQGVLQGQMSAVPAFNGISNGELIIFPNPTSGIVLLRTSFFEPGQLTFNLYDANGRLLIQQAQSIGTFGSYPINLSAYSDGVYMLHATFTNSAGEKRSRTFKIVKLS